MSVDAITKPMAQRPKIQIDVDPQINLALSAKAGELSVKRHMRVTMKQVILEALKDKYPDMSKLIEKELR